MAQTSTGVRLSISSGTPASYDLSGYGALTYFEIGEITNIPQFGAQYQVVTNNPLATGVTGKHKGFVNYGDPTIDMALNGTDMGQQMLKSACDGLRKNQTHAFMMKYGNGEIRYWSGIVSSYQEAPGSANNMVGLTSQINITRKTIDIPRITLDLSFAENFYSLGGEPKNFSDIITFSRSTSATYFNSAGVLTTAAIDEPCLAYDPSTLEPLGLQVFGSATNLLTYSEQFDNAVWVKGGIATVTPNTDVAPDGTLTADTVHDVGGDISDFAVQSVTATVANGGTVTISLFSKTTTEFVDFGGATPVGATSYKITPFGTYYKHELTRVFVTGGAIAVQLLIGSSTSAKASHVVWGAQLETGSIATPYIKTEASQVTRAADIATVDDLSGWYNQSQGSVFVDYSASSVENNLFLLEFNDGTSLNVMRIAHQFSGNYYTSSIEGGVTTDSVTSIAASAGSRKIAVSILSSIAVDGAFESLATPAVSGMTAMLIGRNFFGGGNVNGHIKTLNYYPSALTENEMKLITL